MDCKIEEIVFDSSNGINKVHGRILIPNDKDSIKGIIQFSHGMCEYFDKYNYFAEFLISNGYIFCGNDHIGHGDSVNSPEDRGFFASENGYQYLIDDVNKMNNIVKERYPKLPCFLLGHSMGSFIARCYAAKYGDKINGLLICGTIGHQWAVDAGIQLADRVIKKKGERYRSKTLDKFAFEFANVNFEPIKTRYDWTCSDENVIEKRLHDDKSNFIFTAAAFRDLFQLVKLCNSDKYIVNTPKGLPIFIFSGSMDPLCENGEGIRRVVELYKKIGVKDIEVKLYKDKRHEMLNETNKEEVFNDILNWIEAVRFGEE